MPMTLPDLLFYLIEAAVLLVIVVFLAKTIRIVPEQQRLAVYRLGKYLGTKGPGIILTLPPIDRVVEVKVGATGSLTTEKTMAIRDQEIPVMVLDGSAPGYPVTIQEFDRGTILVAHLPAHMSDL